MPYLTRGGMRQRDKREGGGMNILYTAEATSEVDEGATGRTSDRPR